MEFLWNAASGYDDSLAAFASLIPALASKQVKPVGYSRSRLYDRMLSCAPSLFNDFELPRSERCTWRSLDSPSIPDLLRKAFARESARVRSGESIRHVPIPDIMERWDRERSVFGVTDFHYIGTRFDRIVDTSGLNDFNLLPRGTEGFQSQDSLVISSKGAVTDSHSDDHGGSNHSFIGCKLWLLWDTLEGLGRGLQDVERCDVRGRAAFDLTEFICMRTSSWILIGPGQTMFIPAHLTHKVITLEKYIGLGSFHAALPAFPDLLSRWNSLKPGWTEQRFGNVDCSVEFLTRRAIRKMHSLRHASEAERVRWGVPQLQARMRMRRARYGAAQLYDSCDEDACLKAFNHAARQL